MISVYKIFQGEEVIIYGENIQLPEFLKFELVKENIDPSAEEYRNLAILNFEMLMNSILGKRTRDRILEENGINTFNDLSMEYFLIRTVASNKSRQVRDYVVEKYSEILNLIEDDKSRSNKSDSSSV